MARATVDAHLSCSPHKSSVTSVSTTFDTNEVGCLEIQIRPLGFQGVHVRGLCFVIFRASLLLLLLPCLASVHYLLTVHTDCLVLTYVHVSYNSAAHSYVPPSAIA
jgi:hypothetical protein